MSKEILCTLGPSSMNERTIRRLDGLGVNLFRINLSHTKIEDLAGIIEFVQGCTKVPLCLDTEGAQIRTGDMETPGVEASENSLIRIPLGPVPGNETALNFYPRNIINDFRTGDLISIDFDSVLGQVIDFEGDGDEKRAVLRVLNGGRIGRNKAVTVDRDIAMPPLTEKDEAALRLGVKKGIRHFALSFANRRADLDVIRDIVGDAFVISKIECLKGLGNLNEITEGSDAILIDRGDLSRQVPLEAIPKTQKKIIRRAKDLDKRVYVATNLLETMVSSSTPTRAEVNDIYNTLCDGADGLVLAAETAIGDFPIRCANMIVKMIKYFEAPDVGVDSFIHEDPVSLLPPPHGNIPGGLPVKARGKNPAAAALAGIKVLSPGRRALIDCENLGTGLYSPLTGFMGKDDLETVLESHRLADGTPWPLPLILPVDAAEANALRRGERIGLADDGGMVHAVIEVSEIFEIDPGAQGLRQGSGSGICIAGDVAPIENHGSMAPDFALTAAQARHIFTHKDWNMVIGFHAVDTAADVYRRIQMAALDETGGDGIFITAGAVNGHSQACIMKSYWAMIGADDAKREKMMLGTFPVYCRGGGAREIVFDAICHKNLGCSHFIIGHQDGGYLAPDILRQVKNLFDTLQDIGIEPVYVDDAGKER